MLRTQQILESTHDKFKINPKYYEAIPRPSYDEQRALNESIIVNGQMNPIIVNKNMVILDGHSRFENLQSRGMKIKYVVYHFDNEEDEYKFVVESNIMRRNLNSFQRIEAMYVFYKNEREKKMMAMKNIETVYSILTCIKTGKITSKDISKEVGISSDRVAHILKELVDDYSVSRKMVRDGSSNYFEYSLLPRAEEMLERDFRWKSKLSISRLIGVSKTTLEKGVYLIENANEETLNNLRKNHIHIATAYGYMMNLTPNGKRLGLKFLRPSSILQCPCCNQTFRKRQLIVKKR